LRTARSLPEELGHAFVHPHPDGQCVTVAAVGGDGVIVLPHQGDGPDGHRFLAVVKMEKSPNIALVILCQREVFEPPDADHRSVETDLVGVAEITVDRRAGKIHHGEGWVGGVFLHAGRFGACILGPSVPRKS
jgi:hypothetical protein